MDSLKHKLIRLLPSIVVIGVIVLAVFLVMLLKDWSSDGNKPHKKMIQKITMLRPPPPPPPPEIKQIEPEVEDEIEAPAEEDIVDDMPEDSSEPMGEDLGIDAEGTGGGDSFGLVGRKGGRGLLSGSPFAWYEGVMVSEIQDLLSNLEDLKSEEYSFKIKLKLAFDGTIERVLLVSTTGSKEKDEMLLSALNGLRKFSRMPPGKMPPVVTLKITSTI